MVRLAEENGRRAGVAENIRFFPKNALSIEAKGRRGTIVCNPPYGERMMDRDEVFRLYSAMGAHWKNLGSWQIYVITSDEDFQRHYGRRADEVRKLYNGMMKCFYYQFFRSPEKKERPKKSAAS